MLDSGEEHGKIIHVNMSMLLIYNNTLPPLFKVYFYFLPFFIILFIFFTIIIVYCYIELSFGAVAHMRAIENAF